MPETMPRTLAILAGSFNPPTGAHLALAHAALTRVDHVLFVLPRILPHKEFVGASYKERFSMLETVTAGQEHWSIATSAGGLFVEIAAEAAEHFPQTALWFVCGRDAAERIVNWDYGTPEAFAGMLQSFGLLVARRQGEYLPPEEFAHRIEPLPMENYDEHSSTEVRERARCGEPWRHLVPESIVAEVERIYS
jgi:nicotinate (nicotinamide) nucleotide adenylyltransferase